MICNQSGRPRSHSCLAGVDQIVIGEQQQRVNEIVRRAPAVLGDSVSTLCRICTVGLLRPVLDFRELRRRLVVQHRLEADHLLTFELRVVGDGRHRCPQFGAAVGITVGCRDEQQFVFCGGTSEQPDDGCPKWLRLSHLVPLVTRGAVVRSSAIELHGYRLQGQGRGLTSDVARTTTCGRLKAATRSDGVVARGLAQRAGVEVCIAGVARFVRRRRAAGLVRIRRIAISRVGGTVVRSSLSSSCVIAMFSVRARRPSEHPRHSVRAWTAATMMSMHASVGSAVLSMIRWYRCASS